MLIKIVVKREFILMKIVYILIKCLSLPFDSVENRHETITLFGCGFKVVNHNSSNIRRWDLSVILDVSHSAQCYSCWIYNLHLLFAFDVYIQIETQLML